MLSNNGVQFVVIGVAFCQVGYFPADCVEMIGEKVPQSVATKIPGTPKPGDLFLFSNAVTVSLCYVMLSIRIKCKELLSVPQSGAWTYILDVFFMFYPLSAYFIFCIL